MILVCFGTRPEFIKIKPLLDKMEGKIPFETLFTGQHEDLCSDYFFSKRLRVKEGKNRLDCLVKSVMDEIDFTPYDAVIVQGDTASAFSIALSAFNNKCKVIHLEAGMRTYDKNQPYPEETYRQCISRIADIHLTPSWVETNNLKDEKVQGLVCEVGNTVLDNLVDCKVSYEDFVLVTLHRRENHENMREWFQAIQTLSVLHPELKFILPIHPNPNVQKHKSVLTNIDVVDPLEYHDMIDKISKCKFIISDSGGIQEEASFLQKKVLVCRKETERVALLNCNITMCKSPNELLSKFTSVSENPELKVNSPYGDGKSGEKIVSLLSREFGYE